MDLQETVEVTTPLTHKAVVLRGFITGRIKQAIESVLVGDVDITPGEEMVFKGSVALAATNKALEMIVLSINGNTEDILDQILDLPEEDYDYIKAEVDKIQHPLAKPNSTDSETTTAAISKVKTLPGSTTE